MQLADLLRDNAHVLTAENGRVVGPGADFLVAVTENAQFVSFGEVHYVKQIPRIVTLMFELLQRHHGYRYLALESDPIGSELAAEMEANEGVLALARRYPFAFTFPSDQELEMIATVSQISEAAGPAVWGLDQVFGARHVLDQLIEEAPNDEARAITNALIEATAKFESVRSLDETKFSHVGEHFMAEVPKTDEFYRLADWYHPPPGSRAEFLIEQLLLSDRCYRPYYDDESAARPGVFFDSSLAREENMKRLFMRNYREARQRGDELPKVLLKFGHVHLEYGRSARTRLLTLGNFVTELARSNDLGSVSIMSVCHGEPGHWREIRAWAGMTPVADVADPHAWTLIDLRPLRRQRKLVKTVSPELEEMIWSFDLLLLIGDAEPATLSVIRPRATQDAGPRSR